MKFLLILFSAVLIQKSVYADNLCSRDHLSFPKSLSEINDNQETSCDLCGCFMGIDPNYSNNMVGVRYSSFKYFADANEVNDPLSDHEGHDGTSSTEYYNNIELYGRYYITPKIKLMFNIPFSSNDINGQKLNGFGDMKVFLQYQLYNSSIERHTSFWQRIFLGGGVKIPTGVYNKSFVFGVVDPHFQPGTGSFDILISGNYLAKFVDPGIGFNMDLLYSLNGENKNDYRFANLFNISSSLFYEVLPSKQLTLLPHAGVYYENAKNDKQNGVDVKDSGGWAFFGTGGVDFYLSNYSLELTFQYSFSQNLNGAQPQNEYRFFIGAGYSF